MISEILGLALAVFLLVRCIQRLIFKFGEQGRSFRASSCSSSSWQFYPRSDLEAFLDEHSIKHESHTFTTSTDEVCLQYRRIGSGPKVVYLCNGVGTNLNMWLPIFMRAVGAQKDFFSNVTIIAPAYRGLFGSNSDGPACVTFDRCVGDISHVLRHAGLKRVSCMWGWSTGAQIILQYMLQYPDTADKLFLLNPSTGNTLHSVLQPVVPLPSFLGALVSVGVTSACVGCRPLCETQVWNVIKAIVLSDFAFCVLTVSAFLGGCPPEQPSYFMAYLEDTFSSRYHTQHLLDLILSLDVSLPAAALCLPHQSVVVTGLADVMTGVYHGEALSRSMPRHEYHCFAMGSHFLLMEYPCAVADLVLGLMADELLQAREKLQTKVKTKQTFIDRIRSAKR
jgi:pimeloyl-ACP methyl ester carboxylesterase